MGSVAKVAQLSSADKRTLLASALWLPLFSMGLHAVGLARFRTWLQGAPAAPKVSINSDEIRTIARLVNLAASRSPFKASCLSRSLLLDWQLRRRNVISELRIGVSLDGGALNAHAWVEVEGVPVNDRADIADQFAPFRSVTPAASSHAQ